MIAMATQNIRDHSSNQQFVDYWNSASKTSRAKLLTKAGRNPNYKYRAWDFVPQAIRIDLVAIIKREQPLMSLPKTPRHINTQNHWWNKD